MYGWMVRGAVGWIGNEHFWFSVTPAPTPPEPSIFKYAAPKRNWKDMLVIHVSYEILPLGDLK